MRDGRQAELVSSLVEMEGGGECACARAPIASAHIRLQVADGGAT